MTFLPSKGIFKTSSSEKRQPIYAVRHRVSGPYWDWNHDSGACAADAGPRERPGACRLG